MPPRTQWSHKERDARSRLARLAHQEMLLAGSLVTMARYCGKSRCRCRRGQKHVSLYLSIGHGKGRKMIYVPAELEPLVRQGVQAHLQARQLGEEVSQACLQRFLQAKAELAESRAARKGRQEPSRP